MPGPPTPILWAGAEVKHMQMIFPNLISQISMLSYAGVVNANFVVDADHVVKDPELFRKVYVEELKALASGLGVPFPSSIEKQAKELGTHGF